MMIYRISYEIYQRDLQYPAFFVCPYKKDDIQNIRQDEVQSHV